MRIIKEGKMQPPPEYRKKCNNCGTVFAYMEEDVNASWLIDAVYVKCPLCGHCVNISIFDRKVKN